MLCEEPAQSWHEICLLIGVRHATVAGPPTMMGTFGATSASLPEVARDESRRNEQD